MNGLSTVEAAERLARVGPNALPERVPDLLWRRFLRQFATALGVERRARHRAVVRRLSAVEALGSVTVIATDKTGTLTESRMDVRSLDAPDLPRALAAIVLANDADLMTGAGDPLDLGLLRYATAHGVDIARLRQKHPLLAEVPPLPVLDQPVGSAARGWRRASRVRPQPSRGERDLVLPLTAAQILWINLMTDGLPALALAFDRTPGVMQQPPRPADSPLLDRPSARFVVAAGSMKAVHALGVLGLVPRLGYEIDVARAVAFHFMAVGQLLLTYPSRRTWTRPLPNMYLHAAVIAGIGIQLAAAWLPFSADLLGNASIPIELWGLVLGGALLAWGLAEALSRIARRHHARGGIER